MKLARREFIQVGCCMTVSRYFASPGECVVWNVSEPFHQKDANYRAMMVSGRWRYDVPAPEAALPEYAAGEVSAERPPFVLPGRYVAVAIEECFYLCLSAKPAVSASFEYKRRDLAPFRLPRGAVFAMGSGSAEASGAMGDMASLRGPNNVRALRGEVLIRPLEPVSGIIGAIS